MPDVNKSLYVAVFSSVQISAGSVGHLKRFRFKQVKCSKVIKGCVTFYMLDCFPLSLLWVFSWKMMISKLLNNLKYALFCKIMYIFKNN